MTTMTTTMEPERSRNNSGSSSGRLPTLPRPSTATAMTKTAMKTTTTKTRRRENTLDSRGSGGSRDSLEARREQAEVDHVNRIRASTTTAASSKQQHRRHASDGAVGTVARRQRAGSEESDVFLALAREGQSTAVVRSKKVPPPATPEQAPHQRVDNKHISSVAAQPPTIKALQRHAMQFRVPPMASLKEPHSEPAHHELIEIKNNNNNNNNTLLFPSLPQSDPSTMPTPLTRADERLQQIRLRRTSQLALALPPVQQHQQLLTSSNDTPHSDPHPLTQDGARRIRSLNPGSIRQRTAAMNSTRRQRVLEPSQQPANTGSALTQFRGRKTQLTIKPAPGGTGGANGEAISPRTLTFPTTKLSTSQSRAQALLRPKSSSGAGHQNQNQNQHSKISFFSRSFDTHPHPSSHSSPRLQRTSPSPDPTSQRITRTGGAAAAAGGTTTITTRLERSNSTGSSSDASSKMWDELDQLKSRIRNLERNSRGGSGGGLDASNSGTGTGTGTGTSGAGGTGTTGGERPRTATTTTLTTMSTSPTTGGGGGAGGGSGLVVSRRRPKNPQDPSNLPQHLHHRRLSDPSLQIPRSHGVNHPTAVPGTIEGGGGLTVNASGGSTPLNSTPGGGNNHTTYPLLQKALAHARPLLSREVYDALEATATDALTLTELSSFGSAAAAAAGRHRDISVGPGGGSGSEYDSGSISSRMMDHHHHHHYHQQGGRQGRGRQGPGPGPTSHPPPPPSLTAMTTTTGGLGRGGSGSGMSDRALRRKADNICRSLTELCIALAGEAATGGAGAGGVGPGVGASGTGGIDGMMPGYHATAMATSQGVTSRALIRAEARKVAAANAAAASAGDSMK
ncbi:MAG: hypothetical protein M1823_003607 [Watsoniomyces obsoletus]|nr:MAG: hypothetical protein M1823_003607 [Watsoniomyces obsoletus]